MEMERHLNETSLAVPSQRISLPPTSSYEGKILNDNIFIKPDPDEMEYNLNKTSQGVSNQQIPLHSILEISRSKDSTHIKLDPDEIGYNVNKTDQNISNKQIPLPSPLKYEVKEEIMFCQFCSYSNTDFDRLKFHTFTQHPTGAAVVNFGESNHDIKFFCVNETCNFSTTMCTDYEEHLMNCCPLHQTLLGKEKERLKTTLHFVLDFHNKHCLSDATGLLEFLSSLEKTYGSEDENVQLRRHMEHDDLFSTVSRSSSHSNIQSSMTFGDVEGRNLESQYSSDSSIVPVFIVQNLNTNLIESQTNLTGTENSSMSVKRQNKNNDSLVKTGPSEMKSSKCQVHTHMETETGEKPCVESDKCFRYHSDLLAHMRIRLDKKPFNFKCDVCDREFADLSNRNRHKRRHTGEKPFKCDVCGQEFTRSHNLIVHKRKHTGEKPFTCLECNKRFSVSSNFYRHMKIHFGDKPFICDVCHLTFTKSSYLIRHKETHSDKKHCKCNVCDKGFVYSNQLFVHQRTHTGEKPFKCNVCDKGFADSNYLIVHKRTHTGEKPLICDVCDKGFADSSTLVRHKRTHTGEKPFKCDECDKEFTVSCTLIRHKRTHTGEKPFKCNVCDKEFTASNHLIVHKRKHTGEKPYICKVCDRGFADTSTLNRHKRIHR